MKRYLLLTALCALTLPTLAAGRAAEIIAQLSSGFRTMKGYSVAFTVTAGDYLSKGNYAVEGDRYYLTLGDAEVFCDGETRYEVDNRRREVTVTGVDPSSRNILNNPTQAFDYLGSEYTPSLLWERDGKAAVLLTPLRKVTASSYKITVTVSLAPIRPESLSYDYDGEHVQIALGSITPQSTSIRSFDRDKFAGYEFIDFR